MKYTEENINEMKRNTKSSNPYKKNFYKIYISKKYKRVKVLF